TRRSRRYLFPYTTLFRSGALQYVPFAALQIPELSVAGEQGAVDRSSKPNTDYRPLIADHEIVSLPSTSILTVLRRETDGRKPARSEEHTSELQSPDHLVC